MTFLQSVVQSAVSFAYTLNPYNYFLNPMLFLLLIPAAIFLWIFLRKEFVKVVEDPEIHRRRKLVQKFMFFSRLLIILLLLIALASPFRESQQVIEGDPVITVLTDSSNSMSALTTWDPAIVEKLQNKVEISVQPAGSVETSDIGDAVLNSLGPYQSILLVSDGQVTKGANLGDVALFANKLNATINLIKLKPKESDVAITVEGPGKTKADVDTKFKVLIKRSNDESPIPIKVVVDGKEIINEPTSSNVLSFNYTFTEGTHKIVASINQQDFFPQNNVYYKTIKAVHMPKIIFLTHDTNVPLLQLLRQSFDVEARASFPDFQELDSSYAVITDNMDISDLEPHTETLSNYITQGNGMLTIGGGNSLDKTYRATQFESLLPGFVGKAAKKESDVNVIMLIDVSGSTSSSLVNAQGESEKKVDVMKALAADVIRNSLGSSVKVGVITFSSSAFVVSDLAYLTDKSSLIDKISKLIDEQTGGTRTAIGLNSAIARLTAAKGSKNIILLSDGANQDRNYAIESAKLAANKGIKIYSVQVARVSDFSGESADADNMMAYADITNGIYFASDGAQRLRVLFGDKDNLPPQDFPTLFVVDDNHFITEDLKVDARISGFNDVVPKIPAKLLMTTTNGDPILTAWRLGLGRVALWSSDDGSLWSGDTLGEQASETWTRIGDWIVGEPDRKMAEKVDIPDTRINIPTPILVKSGTVPRADNIGLYKVDEHTYAGTITPKEIGFQNVLGTEFAVNAPFEYENIGVSKDLQAIVASTGGKIFEPNDVDGILKFSQANAKRTVISQDGIRYPWVIAAIIIFLLEIFIRRYLRKE